MDNSTAKVDPPCLEAAGVLFDLGAAVTPPDDARAGSAARYRRAEREQIVMRNVALDDLLPKDHGARVLWQYVEGLDLTPLYQKILAVEGGKGRTPADPRILFALWLYATVEGVGSARGLARLCEEHLAYQWLAGDQSELKKCQRAAQHIGKPRAAYDIAAKVMRQLDAVET